MIATNFRIDIAPRKLFDLEFNGAILGEGVGNHTFYLSAPRKAGHYLIGSRWDLSLGDRDDNGIWRIVKSCSSRIALILSSKPDGADARNYETQFPNGRILAPAGQTHELLEYSRSARPNGVRWNEVLLEAHPGQIFAVDVIGPRPYRRFYLVARREVIEVKPNIVSDSYRGLLHDLRLPYDCVEGEILDRPWCNVIKPSETFPLRHKK